MKSVKVVYTNNDLVDLFGESIYRRIINCIYGKFYTMIYMDYARTIINRFKA